jgi:hypothetical protein
MVPIVIQNTVFALQLAQYPARNRREKIMQVSGQGLLLGNTSISRDIA